MSIEKTIKSQSRNSLADNWIPAAAGFLILFAAGIIAYLTTEILGYFGNIWTEDGLLKSGAEIPFTVSICCGVLAAVLISPLKNGFNKLCYNISVTGKADVQDLFYFFFRNKYIVTLEYNLITALKVILRILLGLIPYFIVKAMTLLFSIELLTTVTANDIFAAVEIILFILGIIAGLILSIPLLLSEFAYVEFDGDLGKTFSASRAIIKEYRKSYFTLFFSFTPWILLCYLVLPAFYVFPYIVTSFANSSKWLLKLYKEGKIV